MCVFLHCKVYFQSNSPQSEVRTAYGTAAAPEPTLQPEIFQIMRHAVQISKRVMSMFIMRLLSMFYMLVSAEETLHYPAYPLLH